MKDSYRYLLNLSVKNIFKVKTHLNSSQIKVHTKLYSINVTILSHQKLTSLPLNQLGGLETAQNEKIEENFMKN